MKTRIFAAPAVKGLSMHICSQPVQDVAYMEVGKTEADVSRHKEEAPS